MVVIRDTKHGNLALIAGMSITARDWSQDFAKLQNLDRLQNIDIAISALRDAIISRFNEQVIAAYTTTPLAAGATWTSTSINVQGFGRITGSCYSDQPGTLYVEQSPDGVNWDVQSTFSYSTGSLLGFSVEVVCPYARIRYVNGATSQSVFRLYVFLRRI